jgi:hypothetical protein
VAASEDGQVALGSLFAQPWWLDAVAPGCWSEVVVENDGRTVARMPYVLRRRYGMRLMAMPLLTASLGPAFATQSGKYATRLARQHRMMDELIEQLPPFDYFQQSFHHSVTNWLPFHWLGFTQTTRYTYVLKHLGDLDAIWSGTRDSVRRAIRKARKQVVVRDDLGLDRFLELNRKTFARQHMRLPYGPDLVSRIDAACAARGCRRMLFAEDAQGRVHAALFLVWNRDAAYYLMGGADTALRGSGAFSLLIWEAIAHAAEVSDSFDFEGSMLQPVERFFSSFGARQTPFHQVRKVNSALLRTALAAGPGASRLGRNLFGRS